MRAKTTYVRRFQHAGLSSSGARLLPARDIPISSYVRGSYCILVWTTATLAAVADSQNVTPSLVVLHTQRHTMHDDAIPPTTTRCDSTRCARVGRMPLHVLTCTCAAHTHTDTHARARMRCARTRYFPAAARLCTGTAAGTHPAIILHTRPPPTPRTQQPKRAVTTITGPYHPGRAARCLLHH